jgi:hypothetical protein
LSPHNFTRRQELETTRNSRMPKPGEIAIAAWQSAPPGGVADGRQRRDRPAAGDQVNQEGTDHADLAR